MVNLCGSLRRAFERMDEMMHGQRGWRKLAILGDKFNKFSGLLEGFIWSSSPRNIENKDKY